MSDEPWHETLTQMRDATDGLHRELLALGVDRADTLESARQRDALDTVLARLAALEADLVEWKDAVDQLKDDVTKWRNRAIALEAERDELRALLETSQREHLEDQR